MKENVDWQMLKSEYAEGSLTLTALAEKYNLSYYVLVRRAGMERWPAKDFGMPNLPKKIIPSETLPINSTESFANG